MTGKYQYNWGGVWGLVAISGKVVIRIIEVFRKTQMVAKIGTEAGCQMDVPAPLAGGKKVNVRKIYLL